MLVIGLILGGCLVLKTRKCGKYTMLIYTLAQFRLFAIPLLVNLIKGAVNCTDELMNMIHPGLSSLTSCCWAPPFIQANVEVVLEIQPLNRIGTGWKYLQKTSRTGRWVLAIASFSTMVIITLLEFLQECCIALVGILVFRDNNKNTLEL